MHYDNHLTNICSKTLFNNTIMRLVKYDMFLSAHEPDSVNVGGTYLVEEITEQSIKVFSQLTSACLVVFSNYIAASHAL